MKIIKNFTNLRLNKPSAITIGVFDGVHIGHQHLIKKIIYFAKKINGQSIVFTFENHPEFIVKKQSQIKLLKSIDDKINLIKFCGVDIIIILKFSEIMNIEPETFIKKLKEKVNFKYIIAGRDFRFGKDKKGNIRLLKKISKENDFKVIICNYKKINGMRVSSSLIRRYLKKGDIKMVEKLLGRKYQIEGKVVHGKHIGFKLGFPTANINVEYAEIPAKGVWAVIVKYKNKKYLGAANIGYAPTLKKQKDVLIEIYIFDFNKKIYGEKLQIIFLEKIRDEKKFKTKEELIKTVQNDINLIKKKFHNKIHNKI